MAPSGFHTASGVRRLESRVLRRFPHAGPVQIYTASRKAAAVAGAMATVPKTKASRHPLKITAQVIFFYKNAIHA